MKKYFGKIIIIILWEHLCVPVRNLKHEESFLKQHFFHQFFMLKSFSYKIYVSSFPVFQDVKLRWERKRARILLEMRKFLTSHILSLSLALILRENWEKLFVSIGKWNSLEYFQKSSGVKEKLYFPRIFPLSLSHKNFLSISNKI